MGTTYTGTMDPPPISFTTQPAEFFPDDRQGTLVEINALPGGASVDGIFYFNSPTSGKYLKRVIDGPIRAIQCGVYSSAHPSFTSAADNATNLQAAFSHGEIMEVVFDDPAGGDIPLTGTITVPTGKKLRFLQGNYLDGPATLSGGIIDAGYDQQIFTTDMDVNPEGLASTMFSVKWFGAAPAAAASVNQTAMQKTFDTVVANQTKFRSIYIPVGTYSLNAALLLYSWNGTRYMQVAVDVKGEFGYASGTGTILQFSQNDTFGIGIQQGKGCTIEGLAVIGAFVPPNVNGYDWYSLTIDEFVSTAVAPARDNQYSPYTGIVIDPFTNEPSPKPPGDLYPGMSSYYRGPGGGIANAGSTGLFIKNCSVANFVVGFMCSPNGITRNAELIAVSDMQFSFCQVAIACSQDQEKANTFHRIMCWNDIHTVFVSGKYGTGIPGNWYGSVINIAGRVNRFVDNNGLGYYPSYFEKIFAEGLGSIGFLGTRLQTCIKEAAIDFARPVDRGFIDYVIDGNNCLYQNCMLRYYGTSIPISVRGNVYFNECFFESPPYCPNNGVGTAFGRPVLTNCTYESLNFGVEQRNTTLTVNVIRTPIYGKVRVADADKYRLGGYEEIEMDGNESTCREYWASTFNDYDVVNIAPDASREAVVTVLAKHIDKFQPNRLCVDVNFNIIGLIYSVNSGANQITIRSIPRNIVSGNYSIGCVYPKLLQGSFMGDLTVNSPIVQRVVFDKWGVDTSGIINTLIEFPTIMNFAMVNYQNVALIKGYNASTGEITLDIPSPYTIKAAYIGFGITKKTFYSFGGNPYYTDSILTQGSEIVSTTTSQRFIVIKTGFLDAAAVTGLPWGTDTRQAEWQELGHSLRDAFTLATNGTRGVSADTDAAYIRISPASNLAAFTVGTTLGGTDVVPATAVTSGSWTVFNISRYFPAATLLYFGGITSSTDVVIIKL